MCLIHQLVGKVSPSTLSTVDNFSDLLSQNTLDRIVTNRQSISQKPQHCFLVISPQPI